MRISLPLTVTIPRKTKDDMKIPLNLNRYRNLHHMTNNQMKVIYKGIVWAEVRKSEQTIGEPPFRFHYTVYPQNKREFDLGNVLPIVQKFTDDALIELGLISDDNYKIVQDVSYSFGGIDKENPRAELIISEFRPDEFTSE